MEVRADMGQVIAQVDAFTDRPFAGNPAGVCVLAGPADAGWMQQVAAEMNVSETAFLYPVEDGYHLRWFTPGAEVPLCGHATLASAHILWQDGHLPPEREARFHTLSGLLTARRVKGLIELDFPTDAYEPCEAPAEVLAAFAERPVAVHRTHNRYLLEFATEAEVRAARPQVARFAAVPVQGVVITARATTAPFDFVSRYFAPRVGVNEDPVTGSSHCSLTPYWVERLGKSVLTAYQASARGGVLHLRLAGERVKIAGQAVTVLRGELLSAERATE